MRFFDILVARSLDERAIGKDGQIPWTFKDDLRWFRDCTNAGIIIMGRRTWESLPVKPLPNRIHCIVSRSVAGDVGLPPNCFGFGSLNDALQFSRDLHPDRKCFVVGGEAMYREALASPWCRRVLETVVHLTVEGATVFFPNVDTDCYEKTQKTESVIDIPSQLRYHRCIWTRKLPMVWMIGTSCYEKEWLEMCLRRVPTYSVEAVEAVEAFKKPIPNALLILNDLRTHRGILEAYHREKVPFYLIHLSDEYLDDEYHIYHSTYCLRVFRHYIHPLYLSHPKISTFGIGYRRGLGERGCLPMEQGNYVWSFAGYVRKSDRTQILELFKPLGTHFIYETKGFERGIMEPEAYFHVMKQSKFVLCPVGNCSIDTFRLYEALEAGSVPVVLCANVNQPFVRYLGHYWKTLFMEDVPFVCCGTWEENVEIVRQYLRYPMLYDTVLAQCRQFWERYKDRLTELFQTHLLNEKENN